MAVLKKTYTLRDVIKLWRSEESIEIIADIQDGIEASAQFLHTYLANQDKPVYGVNTGFGSLQNVGISDHDLHALQRNLLITHAAGTGRILPVDLVRLMLLLKIINISKGYSAVRMEIVRRLLFFYNHKLTPEVHEQGSLGASGDLAPLAEMCLPLVGLGKLYHPEHGWMETQMAEKKFDFKPIILGPKEALALINGTQFMLAHAIKLAEGIFQMQRILPKVAALSTDVFLCRLDPFHPHLQTVRPHIGQEVIATEIRSLLEGSAMQNETRPAVQDPYSFRCIPQVHGASHMAFAHCTEVWETELNSVTDNPTVFMDEGLILSGGNFHGQPLAITLDYAAIALAELGSISERRTFLLLSGQRGLPLYLAPKPGIDSGYMIAQYTAAALVSKNKLLCAPASVDSIVSSNGQEDHVSMGSHSAVKGLELLENVRNVIAIEFLCGSQAASFRDNKTAQPMEELRENLQLVQDEHCFEPMHTLISQAYEVLWLPN